MFVCTCMYVYYVSLYVRKRACTSACADVCLHPLSRVRACMRAGAIAVRVLGVTHLLPHHDNLKHLEHIRQDDIDDDQHREHVEEHEKSPRPATPPKVTQWVMNNAKQVTVQ